MDVTELPPRVAEAAASIYRRAHSGRSIVVDQCVPDMRDNIAKAIRLAQTFIAEIPRNGITAELRTQLYGGIDPMTYADPAYLDAGYPHTNLVPEIVEAILDVVKPQAWLEIGSMLGGSAIRVADIVKRKGLDTEIVCIDSFTGDVNMWAWEQPTRARNEWQFLRLERGAPTIRDRFLANVAASGHADIILPITITSIVGIRLLRRLVAEDRLSMLPSVVYLDSAHEPAETLLEMQNCWDLLPGGGVLLGDDWGWETVRNDAIRFADTVQINEELKARLRERHPPFEDHGGILLDRGQWAIVK